MKSRFCGTLIVYGLDCFCLFPVESCGLLPWEKHWSLRLLLFRPFTCLLIYYPARFSECRNINLRNVGDARSRRPKLIKFGFGSKLCVSVSVVRTLHQTISDFPYFNHIELLMKLQIFIFLFFFSYPIKTFHFSTQFGKLEKKSVSVQRIDELNFQFKN